MKMLIINGSPHAEQNNSNSAIFISELQKGMAEPSEVCCVAKRDPAELAEYLRGFDTVLFVMPLYIHAMPGIVMKLFEHMEPAADGENKAMGFLVQQGFCEAAQSRYLVPYLEQFTKRMNYKYLGCVLHGDSAGTYMMPEKATGKLRGDLNALGAALQKTGAFDPAIAKELAEPCELAPALAKKYQRLQNFKIGHLLWYMMLLKNKAFTKRRDRPFS